MRVVTLSTDFGQGDYACGLMHGVIWSISPDAEIVDLTHAIPRHDVLAGALSLDRSMPYFPPGTVHVTVVDPGVGTTRRPMAARLGNQYFVGPDNGLISLAVNRCQQADYSVDFIHLNRPAYWLKDVSSIFHGRDIFAPAAAYLANGIEMDELGTTINDPVLLDIPPLIERENGLIAHIMHVDHFGNLSTNLPAGRLDEASSIVIHVGTTTIHGISNTFGDKDPGEPVAIFDSSGYLSICVVNGSAENRLGLSAGSSVDVNWS